MKRKVLAAAVLAFLAIQSKSFAAADVQDRGAISTFTVISYIIGTSPTLIPSTGTNVAEAYPTDQYSLLGATTPPVVKNGDKMLNRVNLDFRNDTSTTVWLGGPNVSSSAGSNYGFSMLPGDTWSHNCNIKYHYAIAATTTSQKFVVVQER